MADGEAMLLMALAYRHLERCRLIAADEKGRTDGPKHCLQHRFCCYCKRRRRWRDRGGIRALHI